MIITVDGPAGAGKSTVSRLLAERLSYRYLDTGALYRSIAYAAEKEGISGEADEILRALCERTTIEMVSEAMNIRVFVNGADATQDIRTPGISLLASRMSANPAVRAGLLGLQRKMAAEGGIVAEGRDMGTVVFPDAEVKFFLEADVDERARRRFSELKQKGFEISRDAVREEIIIRDRQDRERSVAPLRPAEDAVIIDSTGLGIEDVVDRMARFVEERGLS